MVGICATEIELLTIKWGKRNGKVSKRDVANTVTVEKNRKKSECTEGGGGETGTEGEDGHKKVK